MFGDGILILLLIFTYFYSSGLEASRLFTRIVFSIIFNIFFLKKIFAKEIKLKYFNGTYHPVPCRIIYVKQLIYFSVLNMIIDICRHA